MKQEFRRWVKSLRWQLASKLIRWAIQLTVDDMDERLSHTAFAFIEEMHRVNQEVNGRLDGGKDGGGLGERFG